MTPARSRNSSARCGWSHSRAWRPPRPSPPRARPSRSRTTRCSRCTLAKRFGLRPTCAVNRRRRVRGSRPSARLPHPPENPATAPGGRDHRRIRRKRHPTICPSSTSSITASALVRGSAASSSRSRRHAPERPHSASTGTSSSRTRPAAREEAVSAAPARTSRTRARDPLRIRSPMPGRSARRPWRPAPVNLAGPAERAERVPVQVHPQPGFRTGQDLLDRRRGCSPARYVIAVTSPASGGPGRRMTTGTAAVPFRQDPGRRRLAGSEPTGPPPAAARIRKAPHDGR